MGGKIADPVAYLWTKPIGLKLIFFPSELLCTATCRVLQTQNFHDEGFLQS